MRLPGHKFVIVHRDVVGLWFLHATGGWTRQLAFARHFGEYDAARAELEAMNGVQSFDPPSQLVLLDDAYQLVLADLRGEVRRG
jgi:hypothetical protein